jgi:TfoX/Sxy family transcriptional regulator of competence genes
MAFDELLAERVRRIIGQREGVLEKKMFGGIAFLLYGNMSCGVHGHELIARVDPTETDRLLENPGVRLFDITGRPMKGWLLIDATSLAGESHLASWVQRSLDFAAALPRK